ncbi:MAG TPA: cupin domain-containing protein [Chitinophagaceae bacterium]|nr:cupin domain-containing protein [Chitinophagaceae bacterium]
MKKVIRLGFFAMIIAPLFISCNSKDKKKDANATDTTKQTTTTTSTDDKTNMDDVTVAPNFYKLVADSLGIRMVEVMYKPGDSSALHWHPDYAIYAIEGGTATFYAKDGTRTDIVLKAGQALIHAGEWHSVKNNGKTNIHVMLVEPSRTGAEATMDASMDAVKVAPNLYKTLADTLGLRILQVNYKPGQESAMHSHPEQALYVTESGTGEFTDKDGSKKVINLTKGMAVIVPGGTHSVKNIGKTTMRAILVEVKRGM